MQILFIDTHDKYIKVALIKDDIVKFKKKESDKSHSTFLVSMIEEIMKENDVTFDDINGIIAINGPGSFTGIRIGLSAAKVLSYVKNIPIYIISSLTSILVSDKSSINKMAVIPDNKGFYISAFDKNNNTIIKEQYVKSIDEYKNKYKLLYSDTFNIINITKYALKNGKENVFKVKANYVKSIGVDNDKKN